MDRVWLPLLGKDKEPAWLEVPKEELEELIVWGLAWK
jgi:hypothetical protein